MQDVYTQRATDTLQHLVKGGPPQNKRGRKPGKHGSKDHKGDDHTNKQLENQPNAAIRHHLAAGIIQEHPQLPPQDPCAIKELLTMNSRNYYLNDPALVSMYERKIGMRELQTWLRKGPRQIPERLV